MKTQGGPGAEFAKVLDGGVLIGFAETTASGDYRPSAIDIVSESRYDFSP